MQLITIAHLGEAQGLIERFNLKKSSETLYVGSLFNLLLTGEGPFEAAISTAAELGRADYQEVINLGICGALQTSLEIGSIFEVRSLYLSIDGKPQFRSFPLSDKGIDLLTSFERVLDPEKAQKLRGVAKLIDREAWGGAYAAKEAKVKFRSFKIISDHAGSIGACELVREKAEEFSQRLTSFFAENLLNTSSAQMEDSHTLGPEFYFSFSNTHRLSGLIQKLTLLRGVERSMILNQLPLQDLKDQKISPKERGKLLLEILENELDPFQGMIKKEISELKAEWERRGVKLLFDPRLEEEKITFSFEAKDSESLLSNLQKLESFNFDPISKIFKGEVDVE